MSDYDASNLTLEQKAGLDALKQGLRERPRRVPEMAPIAGPAPLAPPSIPPMKRQVGGDHYTRMAIQPAEFCIRNNIPFVEGSVIGYVCRHRHKGGREDIQKAIHLLQILLEFYEEPEET